MTQIEDLARQKRMEAQAASKPFIWALQGKETELVQVGTPNAVQTPTLTCHCSRLATSVEHLT